MSRAETVTETDRLSDEERECIEISNEAIEECARLCRAVHESTRNVSPDERRNRTRQVATNVDRASEQQTRTSH